MTNRPTRTDGAVPSSPLRLCPIRPCLSPPVPVFTHAVFTHFLRTFCKSFLGVEFECVLAHLHFGVLAYEVFACGALPYAAQFDNRNFNLSFRDQLGRAWAR